MVFPSMSVAFFLAITRYLTGATEGKEGLFDFEFKGTIPSLRDGMAAKMGETGR